MRKPSVVLLFVFLLIIPMHLALSDQQSDKLKSILAIVKDDKVKFEQVLDLLNEKNTDLSGEKEIISIIKAAAGKHGVSLDNYPNIKGLKPDIVTYILIGAGFMFIVLGFELYRRKHKRSHYEEMHELTEPHGVHIPSQKLDNLHLYVKNCLERGYPKEGIKQTLLKQGWDEKTVDSIINKY